MISLKLDKIALAHTADDNVETFLMRLVRGSGPRGLLGIPPVRGKIIRPLIEVRRKELEEYLKSIGVKARTDRSNRDVRFFRNSVRHELIPFLEKYNPAVRETIIRTVEVVSRDHDLIEKEAAEFMRHVLKKGTSVELSIIKLERLHEAVRAEVIRQAILNVKKDLTDITFVNISDIIGALGKNRAEVDLPGVRAYVGGGRLTVSKQRIVRQRSAPDSF